MASVAFGLESTMPAKKIGTAATMLKTPLNCCDSCIEVPSEPTEPITTA